MLDRALELYSTFCNDNDEEDSPSPLIHIFIQEGGRRIYKGFTLCSKAEIQRLWDVVCVDFMVRQSNARGPQYKINPKDVLFITLSVLHLATKWENHSIKFRITVQICKKKVLKAYCITGSILKDEFVRDVLIDEFNSAGIKPFVKYSIPHHTTDTNVTEFNRPIGTHCKAKG